MPGRYDKGSPPTQEDFTGHVKDDATGLHYAGARYYSAAFGRWTTTDPILGEKGAKELLEDESRLLTMTSYNYAFDRPTVLNDPTGLAPDDIVVEGTEGKTLTVKTERDEVTKVSVPVELEKSRTVSLEGFKETSENFAIGVQVAGSLTETAYAGAKQEAYVQALSFEAGKTSFIAGVEGAAQGGNSLEVSAGASASVVVVAKTGGTGPATPTEFAGGYTFAGASGSADLGGAEVGADFEVSRSVSGEYTSIEAGASVSGGANLPGFPSPGPSLVGEGGGGGSTFLGTVPIGLGQLILP